jgi:hypothetical protein
MIVDVASYVETILIPTQGYLKESPTNEAPPAPRSTAQRPVEVVRITYNRSGLLMKVKIKPTLYAAFQKAQDRLGEYARYEFSQTIFMRRALDLYCKRLLSAVLTRHRIAQRRFRAADAVF